MAAPTSIDPVHWLRLSLVPGVSLTEQRALLDAFSGAEAIVNASRADIAAIAGDRVAGLLARGPDKELLGRTMRWAAAPGNHVIARGDPRYSPWLEQIHDPPTVLYARGRVELLTKAALAIVGSRNATPQAVADAEAIATALSQCGITIVSGLALGIDAAAHRGGLRAPSSSIAVLGTGADIVYPRRNAALAAMLAELGCIVTELPLGTPPVAGNFPRRNRLISGLSRGVLVVEAAIKSGSLLTVKSALEQNREVFAMPGSIHTPLAKGCHWLIKQGAKLTEDAEDVLEELRYSVPEAIARPPFAEAPADSVLDAMSYAPMSLDQIAQRSGLGAAKLAAHVSRLEIEGRIAALAGGWFQRLKSRVIE